MRVIKNNIKAEKKVIIIISSKEWDEELEK